ncbi:Peptidyl-lysine N-acetyltransferase PatZ [Burkholderiales bacterium]|nr:Peptidyl-lysine N-acetyltransferase PatZ [Burkholderiales bacterium]
MIALPAPIAVAAPLVPAAPLASDLPESLSLDDGRAVTIRPVTPEARNLIQQGIARVSPESSRRRFFTVRRRFSERELDEMTRLDGWRRFALGAVARGPDGPVGAGIARFARVADDPRVAEIALLVVDDFQRVGLGRRLLARLARAALERGVERLTGIVQPDNDPMIALLERHAPGPALVRTGEHLSVEVHLDARRVGTALAA